MALFFYLQKNRKKGGNMRKERKRLDFADRKRIEAMKNSGVKVTEIAQAVAGQKARNQAWTRIWIGFTDL